MTGSNKREIWCSGYETKEKKTSVKVVLHMQGDFNLVLKDFEENRLSSASVQWESKSVKKGTVGCFRLQDDGNMAIYDKNNYSKDKIVPIYNQIWENKGFVFHIK